MSKELKSLESIIGKTIVSANYRKRSNTREDGDDFDERPYLDIVFSDGSSVVVCACFLPYARLSCAGEFPVMIFVAEKAYNDGDEWCSHGEDDMFEIEGEIFPE